MLPASWRTALVTGASSGIGRAFAVSLAGEGLDVVAVARRKDRLEELAEEIAGVHHRNVEVLPADLADPAELGAVEARLGEASRPIDVVVNAAGIGNQGRFATLPVDEEQRQVEVNVVALMRLTRAALPAMVERGTGAVVNVSSIAGHQPIPLWATYSACKAFVTTLTRAVEDELKGTGVQALLVLPGFTTSEFHDHTGFERSLVPGPAWMEPDEVAHAALRALERRRAEVVPGLHFRALALSSRLSPWAVTRRVLRVATRRMW